MVDTESIKVGKKSSLLFAKAGTKIDQQTIDSIVLSKKKKKEIKNMNEVNLIVLIEISKRIE